MSNDEGKNKRRLSQQHEGCDGDGDIENITKGMSGLSSATDDDEAPRPVTGKNKKRRIESDDDEKETEPEGDQEAVPTPGLELEIEHLTESSSSETAIECPIDAEHVMCSPEIRFEDTFSEEDDAGSPQIGAPQQIPQNITNTDETEDTDPDNDRIHELERECQKRAYLDGRFFKVVPEETEINGKIVAICQLCPGEKRFSATFAAPSNLVTHLTNAHDVAAEYRDHVTTKREALKQTTTGPRGGQSVQKTFEKNLTSFVLNTSVPLSIVRNQHFKTMINGLPLRGRQVIQIPSRRTLGRHIDALYHDKIKMIKNIIDRQQYVCTTLDMWSTSTHRYLGMTVHWIEKTTLEQKSAAIACRRFPGSHTFDRIATEVENIHDEFGLNAEKVIASVTDNASNFVKAFREFGVEYSEIGEEETAAEDEILSDDANSASDDENEECVPEEIEAIFPLLPRHFRCGSHTLNLLATTDFLKILNSLPKLLRLHTETMKKCNVLWKLMGSPLQKEKVVGVLGHVLRRPMAVRWNSLYDAVSQIVKEEKEILSMIRQLEVEDSLRERDMRYLKEYGRIFEPISATIDELQGEKNCTYGYLIPNLISLRNRLNSLLSDPQIILCKPLVQGLIKALNKRFEQFYDIKDEGEFAAIAAVLHPMFKGSWLACLPSTAQTKVTNAILKEISKKKTQNVQVDPLPKSNFYDFGPTPSNGMDIIFGDVLPKNELQLFMADPRTDLPMLNSYPIIRKLYIKYNTPLPSSAPVERLFSYAGMANLPRQNRLTPSNFEKRVLTRVNEAKQFF